MVRSLRMPRHKVSCSPPFQKPCAPLERAWRRSFLRRIEFHLRDARGVGVCAWCERVCVVWACVRGVGVCAWCGRVVWLVWVCGCVGVWVEGDGVWVVR